MHCWATGRGGLARVRPRMCVYNNRKRAVARGTAQGQRLRAQVGGLCPVPPMLFAVQWGHSNARNTPANPHCRASRSTWRHCPAQAAGHLPPALAI